MGCITSCLKSKKAARNLLSDNTLSDSASLSTPKKKFRVIVKKPTKHSQPTIKRDETHDDTDEYTSLLGKEFDDRNSDQSVHSLSKRER